MPLLASPPSERTSMPTVRPQSAPVPRPAASRSPWEEASPSTLRGLLRRPWFWFVVVAVLLFATPWLWEQAEERLAAAGSAAEIAMLEVDGAKAYAHLKAICAIGSRIAGTEGMQRQQKMLTDHFEPLGGKVRRQAFLARHPLTGKQIELANLIVEWHPDRAERILLCTHYDTRPFPDQDRRNPKGLFLGANDGGSGTALLMQMGTMMPKLNSKYGVDFVFFDAEELIYSDRDKYFLGSEHFAFDYKAKPPAHRYRWGVLLDMIGDSDLRIFQEQYSVNYPAVRPLVDELWGVARKEGIREFIHRPKWEIRDDHLPLNEIAGIPTCDVIDFDYPHWHTMQDVPEQCSGNSLAKVGHVVWKWLQQVK